MNLLLRTLLVWLSSFLRPRLEILGTSCLPMAVMPNDLDIFGHLNNGRALQVMDLGRFDLILRCMKEHVDRNRWKPVVASSMIKYRRPLHLFAGYTLKTRIVCWDADWVYLEQRLEKGGEAAVAGFIKGIFVGPSGRVPCAEIFGAAAPGLASPSVPDFILRWNDAESAAKKRV